MSKRKRRAFTLVELLVVMFILAVLVGLIIGIGSWVRRSGGEKQTTQALEVMVRALKEFYQITGEYPPDTESATGTWVPDESGKVLLRYLRAEKLLAKYEGLEPDAEAELREKISKRMQEVLRGMPQGTLSPGGDIRDGFGNPMRYWYYKDPDPKKSRYGLAGAPVLISAGQDGYFGDEAELSSQEQRDEAKKDNMRSDQIVR